MKGNGTTRNVLVVDDDAFIRKLITTTLEDVAGVHLIEARDGEEAVKLAEREHPELVFLDVAMPRLDGIEACRRMRQDPEIADTPIIMLTASARSEDESRAADAGADRYLTKPFSPLDLLRIVEDLPERRRN